MAVIFFGQSQPRGAGINQKKMLMKSQSHMNYEMIDKQKMCYFLN